MQVDDDADADYTIEEVQAKLEQEWGADYQTKFEDASRAVQQFFKNDDESLQWLSRRIGNHPMAVRLALRLAAIYSGHGLPAAPFTPNPPADKSLDEQIARFSPGGDLHEKWIGGDRQANEQRLALYKKKHPGSIDVADLAGWGLGINK
jgi:hypothetical protein